MIDLGVTESEINTLWLNKIGEFRPSQASFPFLTSLIARETDFRVYSTLRSDPSSKCAENGNEGKKLRRRVSRHVVLCPYLFLDCTVRPSWAFRKNVHMGFMGGGAVRYENCTSS